MKVLIIEDNPHHFELMQRYLKRAGGFEVFWQKTIVETVEWLKTNHPDVIVTDWRLPDGQPTFLLEALAAEECCPVIVQTAFGDEQIVLQAIKSGAVDYLPKEESHFRELPLVIQRNFQNWQKKQEIKRLEAEKRQIESISKTVLDHIHTGVLYLDAGKTIRIANPYFYELMEISDENKLEGKTLAEAKIPQNKIIEQKIEELDSQPNLTYILATLTLNFNKRVQIRASRIPHLDRYPAGFVILFWDISNFDRQRRLLDSLYRISNEMMNDRLMYKMLEETFSNVLPFEEMWIGWINPNNGNLINEYYVHKGNTPASLCNLLPVFDYALRYKQPFGFNQEEITMLTGCNPEGLPISLMVIPINNQLSDKRGVIALASFQGEYYYSTSDLLIGEILASQFIRSLERITLENQEKSQRKIAEALLSATRAFAGSLQISEVLRNIVFHVTHIISAREIQVWLLENEEFIRQVFIHSSSVEISSERHPIKHFPFLVNLQRENTPCLLQQEHLSNGEAAHLAHSKYCLGIPMVVRGHPNGFLILGLEQPLSSEENPIPILQAFAEQAGQAIENAQLFEEAQHLSIVDELTGLYNRRGLNLLGSREFERSLRFSSSLSVLFCDVDNFKLFNDRYSYRIGDEVLKQVGNIFRKCLRKVDIAARFGGDEFCVILPETSRSDASSIIRKLQDEIIRSPVQVDGQTYPFQLSFGAVSQNTFDSTFESLLIRASQQMQYNKNNRKKFADQIQ